MEKNGPIQAEVLLRRLPRPDRADANAQVARDRLGDLPRGHALLGGAVQHRPGRAADSTAKPEEPGGPSRRWTAGQQPEAVPRRTPTRRARARSRSARGRSRRRPGPCTARRQPGPRPRGRHRSAYARAVAREGPCAGTSRSVTTRRRPGPERSPCGGGGACRCRSSALARVMCRRYPRGGEFPTRTGVRRGRHGRGAAHDDQGLLSSARSPRAPLRRPRSSRGRLVRSCAEARKFPLAGSRATSADRRRR